MIQMANMYMEKAMESEYFTPYHIEAVIAGIHTQTKSYESTYWKTISDLYGKLVEVNKSPIIKLNFCFSLLKSGQLEKARSNINELKPDSFGIHQYLYHAVCSNLSKALGDKPNQKLHLWNAVDSAPNTATRNILKERLKHADLE